MGIIVVFDFADFGIADAAKEAHRCGTFSEPDGYEGISYILAA